MYDNSQLRTALKLAIKKRGISIRKAAEEMGAPYSAVHRWCHDEQSNITKKSREKLLPFIQDYLSVDDRPKDLVKVFNLIDQAHELDSDHKLIAQLESQIQQTIDFYKSLK